MNKQVLINRPKRKLVTNISKMNLKLLFTNILLQCLVRIMLCTWLYLLLLLAGDIHENPGPNSTCSSDTDITSGIPHHLSFVHHNVISIRFKLDILYSELKDFHILAFSET